MPTVHSVKTCDICDKTAHFKVAFYCPQYKVHLCNDHGFSSASSYATPVRSMDYLGIGEMLTKRDLNTFLHKIWEKSAFCAYGTFLRYFISTHKTWDEHFTCCIYIFVQCIWAWSRGFWFFYVNALCFPLIWRANTLWSTFLFRDGFSLNVITHQHVY